MPSEAFLEWLRAQRTGAGDPHPEELAGTYRPAAYLLHSRLLDRELWLAKDEAEAEELEESTPGVPVLTFAEIPQLAKAPPALLRLIFEIKAIFTDARLVG